MLSQSHSVNTSIEFCVTHLLRWKESQSHSVNTSIEFCVTHLLRWKESQSQSEKNALCERAFTRNESECHNQL